MKTVLTILLIILLLGFCQCHRDVSRDNPLLGRYELVAHDNAGQLVFTGSITIESQEQNFVKGKCVIVRQKDAPETLFDQNSRCEALVNGNSIDFDLAPSMDDGGMLLEGQLNNGVISGVWKLDGFVTSGPLGKFEAVKKR